MSRIDVNIDRIVLSGIDPADRHALIGALKAELARVLVDPAARAAIRAWSKGASSRWIRIPL
jgi:hypothetical protein